MSMLYESAAIVSVNNVLYLYQFINVSEKLFEKSQTSILLVIE